MTDLEKLMAMQELKALVANYNLNGDRLRLVEMGALFGDEGVLETADWRAVGSAGVQAQLGGGRGDGPLGALFVRHNLTTSYIDIQDANSATGRHYFFVVSDAGPDHMGVYTDRYHKVGGAWRFQHRRVNIDWVSEKSASYERHIKVIPANRKRNP